MYVECLKALSMMEMLIALGMLYLNFTEEETELFQIIWQATVVLHYKKVDWFPIRKNL